MSTDRPIACSLSATELTQRLGEMQALGNEALLEIRRDKTRAELRFAASASVRERLETIISQEARCCPFLELRLSEHADVITLRVRAPEGAEVTLSEITGAFSSEAQAAAR